VDQRRQRLIMNNIRTATFSRLDFHFFMPFDDL
jgi:hypothetical protein